MFTDREEAGKRLAEKLVACRGKQAIVVGLARGGVVVAREVAAALSLPVDVLVVKKISSPEDTELALGALAPDGISVIDWKLAHRLGTDEVYLNARIAALSDQIRQKILLYRRRKPLVVNGKDVILVDDGAATGATMEAAIKWAKNKQAKRIITALPVAPKDTVFKIQPEVDELVILDIPSDFTSVGQFYQTFPQVEDAEVVQLLR